MKVDGGCHCGYISYETEIDPDSVFLCHCTDCQTLSGTAFRTVVPCPENSFELLAGQLKTYIKTGESGAERPQVFCPECGTQIYSTSVGQGPRQFNLRVGTIRQRAELKPGAQYWFRSAQKWVMDLAGVRQIAKG
ncbi:MAG: GFA family protein [Gammaproteobacteria bacterium]|jgi:hypothetical protein|nr:GFA family protein [Gammaproteobacteria bacterium]